IEGDFGQSDGLNSSRTAFSATDIFVNWHQYPEAQIKVGQWKAPFGLEQLTPDTTLYIIERSLPTGALTPERQLGLQLWGKPFTLPTADERTAWSVDAWLKLGPFDLIGEYLEEYVNGRTVNGVPGMPDFTTNGYYITAGYFLIPKKLQLAMRWEDLNPGQKGN